MTTLMTYVLLSTALPLSFLCLLHTSRPALHLFLTAIPFCWVATAATQKHLQAQEEPGQTPLLIWGVPTRRKQEASGSAVGTQIKPRQFSASAPAVLSLCENHSGLNSDAIGAHFIHCVPILPPFSLLPKSKGTGGDLEVCHHILCEAMGLLLKPKSCTHWH